MIKGDFLQYQIKGRALKVLFLRFGFAVDAAVFAGLSVCQFEDVGNFLLYGSDAARVLAVNDICQFFRKLGVEFFRTSAVFYDIDRYVGVDISQCIQIQIQFCIDFDDVFFAHFLAGCIFDQGNGGVQMIQIQEMIQIHPSACCDVVDYHAVMDCANFHHLCHLQ